MKDIVNQKNDLWDSMTALHRAADLGCLYAAEALNHEWDRPDLTDLNSFTPFHYAAKKDSIDVLKLLIEHGACIEPLASPALRMPLMLAFSEGHVEVAKHLLRFEPNITEDSCGMDLINITLQEADESSEMEQCTILFRGGFNLH